MAVPKTTLSLDRSVGPVNSTCLYISGFLFFILVAYCLYICLSQRQRLL
jgi:hypothetical protein